MALRRSSFGSVAANLPSPRAWKEAVADVPYGLVMEGSHSSPSSCSQTARSTLSGERTRSS
eukprot:3361299-Prymnesium_polylepis.1